MRNLDDLCALYGVAPRAECAALIDGAAVRTVAGVETPLLYPATGERYGTLVADDAATVGRAVAAARRAFLEGPWPLMTVDARNAILRTVAQRIRAEAAQLAALQVMETGVPFAQALNNHIPRTVENFEFFGDVAATMAGQSFTQSGRFLTVTVREPVGVAAIFAPWNAPYILSSMKLAAALATGNCVVLKPSEYTPMSVLRLAEICHEAGVPPGVVNVINGAGPETGRALAEHRHVDAIGFIGGTATGQAIMRAAAGRIARVGLELGGKSANIVCDTADLDAAVDGSLLSIFSGSGQQCLAGSRILVQRGIADAFLAAFTARAAAIRIGDPTDPATEMGPLAFARHRAHVLGMIEAARRDGAQLLTGGGAVPGLEAGCFVQPTVLLADSNSLPICQDEVFGPVAAVQIFDTVDQAIAIANDSDFGLVGYVWSEHLPTVMQVCQGVRTGTMWVNTPLVRDVRAPFGGYKQSGLGRDGRDGCIDLFTEEKTIMLPTGSAAVSRRLGLGAE